MPDSTSTPPPAGGYLHQALLKLTRFASPKTSVHLVNIALVFQGRCRVLDAFAAGCNNTHLLSSAEDPQR